jgi:hypothetical protein
MHLSGGSVSMSVSSTLQFIWELCNFSVSCGCISFSLCFLELYFAFQVISIIFRGLKVPVQFPFVL